jgi:hypothetical protein
MTFGPQIMKGLFDDLLKDDFLFPKPDEGKAQELHELDTKSNRIFYDAMLKSFIYCGAPFDYKKGDIFKKFGCTGGSLRALYYELFTDGAPPESNKRQKRN